MFPMKIFIFIILMVSLSIEVSSGYVTKDDNDDKCDNSNCQPKNKPSIIGSDPKNWEYCEGYTSVELWKKCEDNIKHALESYKCTGDAKKCKKECIDGVKAAIHGSLFSCGWPGTGRYVCCAAALKKEITTTQKTNSEKVIAKDENKNNSEDKHETDEIEYGTSGEDSSGNYDSDDSNEKEETTTHATTIKSTTTTKFEDDSSWELFEPTTERIKHTSTTPKPIESSTYSYVPVVIRHTPTISDRVPICNPVLSGFRCIRYKSCNTGYTYSPITNHCEDINECILNTHNCGELGEMFDCTNMPGTYNCQKKVLIGTNTPYFSEDLSEYYEKQPCIIKKITGSPGVTCQLSHTIEKPKVEIKTIRQRPFFWETVPKKVTVPDYTTKPKHVLIKSLPPPPKVQLCRHEYQVKQYETYPAYYGCDKNPGVITIVPNKIQNYIDCPHGYTLDNRQKCIDIDECHFGNHTCNADQDCINLPGSHTCRCKPGFRLEAKGCVDINECTEYSSRVCSQHATCVNTIGSFKCDCNEGYTHAANSKQICNDIDECASNAGRGDCDHQCVNIWGSYVCRCNKGYKLDSDDKTCIDVNECDTSGYRLCFGECKNTPGSYHCTCPDGYTMGSDQIGCKDIDECQSGDLVCEEDEVCHNIRGSAKCGSVSCPEGYEREFGSKHRCRRLPMPCTRYIRRCTNDDSENDPFHKPDTYSYNFLAMTSNINVPQEKLFTMRSLVWEGAILKFNLRLINVKAPFGVEKASADCFKLTEYPEVAVMSLEKSITGPQEIELELATSFYYNEEFAGSTVAKITIYVSKYDF